MNTPQNCKQCPHVGRYTDGPFVRNPHYCCELIWELYQEDYKVDPEKIDDKCPLKSKHFKHILKKMQKQLYKSQGKEL